MTRCKICTNFLHDARTHCPACGTRVGESITVYDRPIVRAHGAEQPRQNPYSPITSRRYMIGD